MAHVTFRTDGFSDASSTALNELQDHINSSQYAPQSSVIMSFTTDGTKVPSLYAEAQSKMIQEGKLDPALKGHLDNATESAIKDYITEYYNGYESRYTNYIYVSSRIVDNDLPDLIGTAIHEYLHKIDFPCTTYKSGRLAGYHDAEFYGKVLEIAHSFGYTAPDQQNKYDTVTDSLVS